MDFGLSCPDHGFDYRSSGSALSVHVAQDPGGASPGTTGLLCFVCNSDSTARNLRALWEAAVSCGPYDGDGAKYLHCHYATNAIMHGASDEELSRAKEQARRHCSSVLAEQIEILRPTVVIACGKPAANSLREIGLLRSTWDDFRERLTAGAYCEEHKSWGGIEVSVLCTYHAGPLGVARAARLYRDPQTEDSLEQRVAKLEDQTYARRFMETRQSRGMRVLLLHWLDIGEVIRRAHAG